MEFLIIIKILLCLSITVNAENKVVQSGSLVTSEFDWNAWYSLSLEEKERNVLWKNKEHPDHCEPLKEFRIAMDFFRVEKEVINPSEAKARHLSSQISKGCKGAAQRFIKTFLLLFKSGVDQFRAIEYGVEFANADDETVENFFEIFKKTYLNEYFDLDYSTALKVSFELSKSFKGNRQKAREDFLEVSNFCLKKEGMNLPIRLCAELAIKLARLSHYYPEGVQKDFLNLYKLLREDRRFGMNILTSLRVILHVLPFGPTAPSNFLKSYEYAIDPNGLASGGISAIKFAIKMAEHSVKQSPPPIYTPPVLPMPNLKIHDGYGLVSEYKSDSEKRNFEHNNLKDDVKQK